MRIRKRYQNPLPPPDLSSPLPPPTAAAAEAAAVVAPPVAAAGGATEGEEGEAMAAVAAAAAAGVSGSRCGGGGGRELHPNGRTTNPTTCLPFGPPPSGAAAAAAAGAERGDLPPPGPPLPTQDVLVARGHGREVPKQERGGETGRNIGDVHGCGGNAPAPKSLGAKASEVSVGHGGHTLPSVAVAALAAAEAMARWSDEEGEFLPKKRRGGCHAARRSSLGLDEEEDENVGAERGMKQPRPSKSRRRRTAASSSTTMATPAGTALTSAGTGNGGSAPIATGASAAKKYDDMMVKAEGGDVVPAAAAAALVDGNGKKRRSPAVLMEGSRCSRVNGRGWRCCQQTLVGYSLCEHHLGKGRLRSVSSVRCNGRARKKEEVDGAAPSPPSLLWQLNGEDDDEEEKPGRRRRNKIGVVKARSISSLLHQPAHSTPTTIEAPEPFPSPSATPATCPVTAATPPRYGTDTAVP